MSPLKYNLPLKIFTSTKKKKLSFLKLFYCSSIISMFRFFPSIFAETESVSPGVRQISGNKKRCEIWWATLRCGFHYWETYSVEPVLGDHLEPPLLCPSVFAGVVSDPALVDVVRHCVIAGPPQKQDDRDICMIFMHIYQKIQKKN